MQAQILPFILKAGFDGSGVLRSSTDEGTAPLSNRESSVLVICGSRSGRVVRRGGGEKTAARREAMAGLSR